MTRREAREQAFILTFEREFRAGEVPEELYAFELEAQGLRDAAYTKALFLGTMEKSAEIDAVIESASTAWKVGRISRVSLAVLRIAVYEMLFGGAVEYAIAINEAVELAKKYEGKEGAAFVNGVLGGIAKSHPETKQAD